MTGDSITDVVVFDVKTKDFAFIGQPGGRFEKAKIITQDGILFYQTEKGHYDPWGHFFPK